MRALTLSLALLLPSALPAQAPLPASTQVWEGDRSLSVTVEQGGDTLRFCEKTSGGNPRVSTSALRTFRQVHIWKGQGWAVGSRTPWAMSWISKHFGKERLFHAGYTLYTSRDFKTWTPVGGDALNLEPRIHGAFARQFIPLDDGTFLASGELFRDGEAFSPLAIYRSGSKGDLTFVRLLAPAAPGFLSLREIGFEGWEAYKAQWDHLARGFDACVRTPRSLVLVNRAEGFCLVTDNDAVQPFRCVPLRPGESASFLLGMQPRKDGRILVAQSSGLPGDAGMPSLLRGTWAANGLAMAVLQARRPPTGRWSLPVEWSLLDPAEGRLTRVLKSFLYGVKPADPVLYAGGALRRTES